MQGTKGVNMNEILEKNLAEFNNLYKREEIENSKLLQEVFKTEEIFFIVPPFYCKTNKLFIGKNVRINFDCTIFNEYQVTIKENTIIAPRVKLITQSEQNKKRGPITIEKNVWIGSCSKIMPGVTIGQNSIIGAMTTVDRDVPPNVIVAGNPYKIIRNLIPYEIN